MMASRRFETALKPQTTDDTRRYNENSSTFYLPKKPYQLANDAEKVSWVELSTRTVESNELADAGAKLNVLARHFDKQTSVARAKASLPALSSPSITVFHTPDVAQIFTILNPMLLQLSGNLIQPPANELTAANRRAAHWYAFQVRVNPNSAFQGSEDLRAKVTWPAAETFQVVVPIPRNENGAPPPAVFGEIHHAFTAATFRDPRITLMTMTMINQGATPEPMSFKTRSNAVFLDTNASDLQVQLRNFGAKCVYAVGKELIRLDVLGARHNALADASAAVAAVTMRSRDPVTKSLINTTVTEFHQAFMTAVLLLPAANGQFGTDIVATFYNNITTDLRNRLTMADKTFIPKADGETVAQLFARLQSLVNNLTSVESLNKTLNKKVVRMQQQVSRS